VSAQATGTSPPRRQRARRGEGEKLRDEILKAAEDLLIQSGDEDAVSIRAVADRVGVTPPSIYLHFTDKNDLLFEVCERHFQAMDEMVEEEAAQGADPLESLVRRGRAYIRFGREHPEQYRILFMGRPADVHDLSTDRLMQTAGFGKLVEGVRACMDAGAIAAADPLVVALGLWAVVHGVTSLAISKPTLFDTAVLDALVDHLLRVQIDGLRGPALG
jgi:AcrR family transcriptional regulator